MKGSKVSTEQLGAIAAFIWSIACSSGASGLKVGNIGEAVGVKIGEVVVIPFEIHLLCTVKPLYFTGD